MHICRLRIGLSFICLLATGATGIVFAAPLTDIGRDANKTAITALASRGIISGYTDNVFKPNNTMNRAEFMKVLVTSMDVTPSLNTYHDCFSDVSTQWFAPYVCYAKEQGWVQGYSPTVFKPANIVSKPEAIKMIVSAAGYVPVKTVVSTTYTDVVAGAWYAPYVTAAKESGILPTTSGNIGIAKLMTRSMASGLIYASMQARFAAQKIQLAAIPTPWTALMMAMHRGGGGGGGSGDRTNNESSATGGTDHNNEDSTGSLIDPTITFNDMVKNFRDTLTLTATSNGNGSFRYVIADTSVATVSGSSVTLRSSGTTLITVTQAASGSYRSGNAQATLTIHPIAPTITLAPITKNFNQSVTLSPVSNSSGAFTYTSNNAAVATIAGSTVTLTGSGRTIITVTQAASGGYRSGSATGTLTVHPIAPSLTFNDLSANYGTTVTLGATSNSHGAISYASNNTGIATISANLLTPTGVGSTTITATLTASGGYTSAAATAALTVHKGTPAITFVDFLKSDTASPFSVPLTTNSDGSITFLSSDTNTATISGNTVTIVAAGPSTITATEAATAHFTGAVVTALFTVLATDKCADLPCGVHGSCTRTATRMDLSPAPLDGYSCSCDSGYTGTNCELQVPTIGAFTGVTKQMGNIPFTLTTPSSNSAGAFTYTSNNTALVSISGNTVTIIPDDTIMTHTSVTITAHQAANGGYASATTTMTLTVVQGECSTQPCMNDGICTDEPSDTYSCSCVGIYSGTICSLNDSFCNYDHGNEFTMDCKNGGSCVADEIGGHCECVYPFDGSNCQNLAPGAFLPQNLSPVLMACSAKGNGRI